MISISVISFRVIKWRKTKWHTLVAYAEAVEKKLVRDVEVAELSTMERPVIIVRVLEKLNATFATEPVRLMIKREENDYAVFLWSNYDKNC